MNSSLASTSSGLGTTTTAASLKVNDLRASYDNQVALHGVTIDVPPGSCTAVLGSNGAGKTTLMNAIAGIHKEIEGSIDLDARPVHHLAGHDIARLGVCYIPEGRGIFPDLTVAENLRLMIGRDPAVRERLFTRLPALRALANRHSSSLSGGEQQMLAMAPAVVGEYRLLMIDELSLGLAPIIVEELFRLVGEIRATGVTVLLVEQFAERALELADHAYVLRKGRVVFNGPADVLRGNEAALHELYMGASPADKEHGAHN